MSILKKLHAAVEASRAAAEFSVSEENGTLHLVGLMPREALDAWQVVFDEGCPWLTVTLRDAILDNIQPSDGVVGDRANVTVVFRRSNGSAHLITPEGWRILLHNDAAISSVSVVRLAFIAQGFSTLAFAVEPWVDEPADAQINTSENDSGPRRLVRCQSPDLMAPSRIEPWISIRPADNAAFLLWKEVAESKLALSLCNDLSRNGEIAQVEISGQPPRRLDLGAFSSDAPFPALQEAANWCYVEGRDAEVRHTFLTAELAREWPAGVPFCEGLKIRLQVALESARLLYKSHLRAGSKDTLKALADLRKTLAEEVQKLLQQTRDLSSSVWRDVAVAIGVMAIRFAMDSLKTTGPTAGFGWIYAAVAVYIVASYAITLSTSNTFVKIVDESRTVWRGKLYAFLDDADYKALASDPLSNAVLAYKVARLRTGLVVAVVVLGLLVGIEVEMQLGILALLPHFVAHIAAIIMAAIVFWLCYSWPKTDEKK